MLRTENLKIIIPTEIWIFLKNPYHLVKSFATSTQENIHKLRWQASGGRVAQICEWYYISLFSKLVNEGGRTWPKITGMSRGSKIPKICQRSLWMPHNPNELIIKSAYFLKKIVKVFQCVVTSTHTSLKKNLRIFQIIADENCFRIATSRGDFWFLIILID